jgi:small subunit ribosomal protein S14|tara:strand:- start:561 stop:866 length:306 start_codon:yes stop_codon:yes gene_type:complete
MSKKSTIQRNLKRVARSERFSAYREELKKKTNDKSLPLGERFEVNLQLWSLPRDSSLARIRNRDTLTGRPRGYYRYFKLDRISLRDLGRKGLIPGLRSSSW